MIAAVALLVVLTLLVAIVLRPPEVEQENAAAMLTLITAAAVGIERVIETFWIVMGFNGRPWWPFTAVGSRVQEMVNALDDDLEPLQNKAGEILGQVDEGAERATELANRFPNLDQAKWLFDDLDKLGPSNRRVRDLARAASTSAKWFEENSPEKEVKTAAAAIQWKVRALEGFLDTFNDNPGRRLISICLGCIIGVIAAGALGLDALQATLGTTPSVAVVLPNLGTAMTGIVIGLGASPTHEIIRTLQETKQNRAST